MTDHLTENARLRAALEWYADEANYETQYERLPCECCTDIFEPISNDRGELARNTLNHRKEVMPDDEAANPADARHEASPGVTAGADYAAGFAEGIRRAAEVCEIRLTDASFEGDWAQGWCAGVSGTQDDILALATPAPDAVQEAARVFDSADWYWRTMDPDDCGDSPAEAINRSMLGNFCVCEIASSFTGPIRYGFTAPVLDADSDDEEFLHFATRQEAIDAAKERSTALRAIAESEASHG